MLKAQAVPKGVVLWYTAFVEREKETLRFIKDVIVW